MIRLFLATFLGLMATIPPSVAQQSTFPNKPVHLVSPFAAGGPTDMVARRLAQRLSQRLGQPVVVENKPGGATILGIESVMRAPPDGYTVLFTATQIVQLPPLTKVPYEIDRDFRPLALICSVPLVLVTNPELPFKDLKGLIDYTRANPAKSNYGSNGQGGTPNIYGEELLRTNGLKAEHIPYKGEALTTADALTNRIQWYFATPAQVFPHIEKKSLHPIAVTGPNRLAKLPDVPTMAELGASTFNSVGWYGMFLPAKTPKEIADKLSAEIIAVVSEPSFKAFLEDMLFVPRQVGADEFSASIKEISEVWARMIKENNIKME